MSAPSITHARSRSRAGGAPSVLTLLCFLAAVVLAPFALFDLAKVAGLAIDQLAGAVGETDFLNLYTGASLLVYAPAQVYSPDAQLAMEQTIIGPGHAYLGFFLPPYAAVAVAWLGLLPYGAAYVAWLLLGTGCIGLAACLLGRPDGVRGTLAWAVGLLLFLPIVEGLGQGQTSALMLLGAAAFARGTLDRDGPGEDTRWLWLAVLGFILKPQFAVAPLLALALDRRRGTLLRVGLAITGLAAVGVLVAGPDLLSSYRLLSAGKLQESLLAAPDFLPGPTVLHAAQRLMGTGVPAGTLALSIDGLLLCGVAWVWRGGLMRDSRRLLQVAILPVVAVLASPYALVHELSCWPVAFCLLIRYTRGRPRPRAIVLLLALGIWITAALGVMDPNASRGADLAALLGLGVVALIVLSMSRDADGTAERPAAPVALPTISACTSTTCSSSS